MYNIDQQIFDYCTAKFADNTQCCMPVFDIRHELPLCPVHAAKADNYQKQMELENKKKPRKKSKPAALTRPPRKGKKKKKGRYSRQQKALPSADTASGGLDSTLSDIDVLGVDTPSSQPQDADESSTTAIDVVSTSSEEKQPLPTTSSSVPSSFSSTTSSSLPVSHHQPTPLLSSTTGASNPVKTSSLPSSSSSLPSSTSLSVKDRTAPITSQQMEQTMELEETLSPDFDKQFELPLEQASRLLEESDFQEVVNKMPFEALDLFGKQGEGDQEETDQVPLDQVSGNKARDAIERLLCGAMSEEESMQLAMVLAQNLHTDAELAQNTVALLTADSSSGSGAGGVVVDGHAVSGMGTSLENSINALSASSSAGNNSGGGFVSQEPGSLPLQATSHHPNQNQPLASSHPVLHGMTGYSSSTASSSSSVQIQFDPSTGHHQLKTPHHVNPIPAAATTGVTLSTGTSLQSGSSLLSHHKRVAPLSSSLRPSQSAYGQADPFSSSSSPAKIASNQNLLQQQQQQTPSYSGFVTKTFSRSHPADPQPAQAMAGLKIALGSVQLPLNSAAALPGPGRKEPHKVLTLGAPNRTVDASLQRELRIDRTLSSSTLLSQSPSISSSSPVLSSSLSLPSLAKKAKLMNNSPSLSSTTVMQQQQQSSLEANKFLKQQSLEQNLQIKHLKHLQQQQQQQQQLPVPSPLQQHLLSSPSSLKTGRLNLLEPNNATRSPPSMIKLSKSPNPSPALDQNSHNRDITASPKSHTQANMGSPKLKLLPPKSSLSPSDLSVNNSNPTTKVNKLTLPNTKSLTPSHSPSSSTASSSSSSSSSSVLILPQDNASSASNIFKGIGSISTAPNSAVSNSLRYSITSSNNNNNNNNNTNSVGSSPFQSSLQKSLNLTNDEGDGSPSESISVTVRHPSSLEAVPTTVRHTLPDTFPTHDSMPSSPLQLLPKSSPGVNSPTRSLTSSPAPQQSVSASSSPHRLSLDSSNSFKQLKSSPSQASSPATSTSSLQQQQPPSSSADFHSVISSHLQQSSQWTPSPPPPLATHLQQNLNATNVTGLTNGGFPSVNKQNLSINHNSSSPSSSSSSSLATKLNLISTPSQSSLIHAHGLTLSPHSNPNARKIQTNPNLTTLTHPAAAAALGVGSLIGNAKQLHVQPAAMPVVCNAAVTMSKFTPPLPATAFKTSGTS